MAARRKYGKTWWGAAWLAALNDVPDANRLARGRSCYQTGRIIEAGLDTEKLTLSALVDGSAYFPYEVRLRFSPLPAAQHRRLIAAIREDAALTAEILDGALPERLLDLCRRLDVELFPTSWRDLHPHCSCPDASPFCKHLAAVFHLLLDQIDADPFKVFLTRGVDLRRELRESGLDLEGVEQERLPTPAGVLAALAAPEADPRASRTDGEAALEVLRGVAYTGLPDMSGVLEKLLPERFTPTGSDGENHRIAALCARAWRSIRSLAAPQSTENPDPARARDGLTKALAPSAHLKAIAAAGTRLFVSAQLRSHAEPVLALGASFKPPRALRQRQAVLEEARPGALAQALLQISPQDVRELPPELECLQALVFAARALLGARAVAPVPVRPAGTDAGPCPRLWWTPMLREPQTASLVQMLCRGCAPWALSLLSPEARRELELRDDDPAAAYKAVFFILTAVINSLVAGAYEQAPQDPAASAQMPVAAAEPLQPLDGRVPEAFVQAFSHYYRAFLLAGGYPWRPVLTARTHPDGVKINFGILPRAAGAARRPVLLRQLLENKSLASERLAAMNVLKTLARAFAVLGRIAETGGRPATLSASELKTFVLQAAPVLMVLGVTLMLPQSLRRILRPRLVASVSEGAARQPSALALEQLSEFSWQAAVGGRTLSAGEFEELVRHAGEVVRMGEDFVYLDPEALAAIARTLREQPQPSPLERMRAALTGSFLGAEVRPDASLRARLEALTAVSDVPPPAGLRAQLRPYQQRGYAWLMKNLHLGIGALIADDMGLGKTLQVIAALTALKEEGALAHEKALVVVPTTLATNWLRETARFSPALTVALYHGPRRRLAPEGCAPDVTLTTYGTLRRDCALLAARRWRLLVLDEAQAVKNSASSQSMAVRAIRAPQTIAMTGTPVENRLMEYWSILDIVQPHLLGSAADFQRTFAKAIEVDHDPQSSEAFRRLTAPFMLRRLKSDKSIIADLPGKISTDLFTTLTPEQAALYQKTLQTILRRIRTLDEKIRDSAPEARGDLRASRSGAVLQLITSLKQICNSPSQYLGTDAPVPDSGKGAALLETLERCREAGRRTLIFTQYREMGERLQRWIRAAAGESVDFLHGGLSAARRQEMIDRFQGDRAVHAMILSLKAGGTGLNLTAASAVIHYDLWWNPAVEAQATDRAYRIGQRRDVVVYRFITAGTFEERINEMLEKKRTLASLTVAAGEAWIGDLPTRELEKLLSLSGPGGSASC